MKKELVRNRFHVYTGFKNGSKLEKLQQAGEAYDMASSKPYYIVKMWAQPNVAYYLCRSQTNPTRYTLFAKIVGDYENPTFRRPVGFGFLSHDSKNHLEIQLTFPRERIYMSLHPAQTAIDSLFSQPNEEFEI